MLRTVMMILLMLAISCKGAEEKPAAPAPEPEAKPSRELDEPKPDPDPKPSRDQSPKGAGDEPDPKPSRELDEPKPKPSRELDEHLPPPSRELDEPKPKPVVTPASIVDRALEVTGGLEELKFRLPSYTSRSRGQYLGFPCQMTTVWKAPGQMYRTINSGALQLGYGADYCWRAENGVLMDCPPDEAAGVAAQLMVNNLLALYPLKDAGVSLSPLPEGKVNGRVTDRIEVKLPGGPTSMLMDFDRETGALIRVEYEGAFGGKKGVVVYEILRYQYQDGVMVPKKSIITVGGAPLMEQTVDDFSWEVEERFFPRPAQRILGVPTLRRLKAHAALFMVHRGPYEGLSDALGGMTAWAEKSGLKVMGRPTYGYKVNPQQAALPEEYVTEIRVPVMVPSGLQVENHIYALKQMEGTVIVARLEQGTYEKAAAAFGPLMAWCGENRYEVTGFPSLISYSDPTRTPEAQLLNEVFFTVRKKD